MDNEPKKSPFEIEEETSPQSPFVQAEEKPVPQSTPAPKPEPEPIPEDDPIPLEEDDDLLVNEDEEDFFFLLQNIFWGAMKSLFIVFVLVAILWIIWKKDPSEEKTLIPISEVETPGQEDPLPTVSGQEETNLPWWKTLFAKDETKKEEPKTDEVTVNQPKTIDPIEPLPSKQTNPSTNPLKQFISTENAATEAARWHIFLEKQRLFELENNLTEGSLWIRKTQSLYTVGFPQQIKGANPIQRKQSIQALLGNLNNLLTESFRIRTQLYTAKIEFAQKSEQAFNAVNILQERINTLLQTNRSETIPTLTEQKAEYAKIQSFNQTNLDTYDYFILYIEQYDRSIREIYEVIYANQDAIAHNIRVVDFPTDPFHSVLTPTEWRGGSTQ